MTATRAKWTAAWLTAVAMTLLAPRGHAGLGDLDVRFGSSGRLEIDDPYDAQVLVQPDGKILAVGSTCNATGADYLVLTRWLSDGRPDLGYGPGGRVVVPATAWEVCSFEAAALQPDGKILLAGAGGLSALPGAWVRWIARIDASGHLDASFGAGGIVNGGTAGPGSPMFGPGYGALRVLPNGDVLAALNDNGVHLVDRFGPDGRFLAGTGVAGEVIDLAADSDGTAIVLNRRDIGGVLWRLLPNGAVDRGFGDQGYAEISNTYALAMAVDPGARYFVCGSAGIHAYDSKGRADTSFGGNDDGRVPFDEQSLPDASECGLAITPLGGSLSSGGDLVVVAAGWTRGFKTGTARLDGNGRPDRKVGAGKGWQVVRTRQLPGTGLSLLAVHRRAAANPLAVWRVTDAAGVSSVVVQAMDLGTGSTPGAAGVTEHPTPFSEVPNEDLGVDVLRVVRSGPPTGAARVRYELVPGTAAADDVALPGGELRWADGDATSREIQLPVTNDDRLEGEETFQLRLFDASGVDIAQEFTTFTIVDDEALRALRFENTSVTWPAGPSPPFSAWPEWVLHLDVSVPGPVTVFHLLSNGVDSCCLGRLQWAAGEHGTRSIASHPGERSGLGQPGYFVFLYDGTWRGLEQDARIEQVIPQPPTVTPPPPQTGVSPFNPTPKPASGDGEGGGGAFDLVAAAGWLALLLVRRAGRRHALR